VAKTNYQSVDEYLAQLAEPGRSVLGRVVALIAKTVPRAVPVISYQIAAFKLEGRALLYLAAWKQHYSLYPATAGVIARLGTKLARHRDGKGTLRFAFDEPIPTALLASIAKVRAAEVAEAEALKASKRRPSKRASVGKPAPFVKPAKPSAKTGKATKARAAKATKARAAKATKAKRAPAKQRAR
jgi:uncharacterized protein YdhG (YjbR/CyaY superfamily)